MFEGHLGDEMLFDVQFHRGVDSKLRRWRHARNPSSGQVSEQLQSSHMPASVERI